MTKNKKGLKCTICGCTQEKACAGGCYWIKPGLCSNHALKQQPEKHGIPVLLSAIIPGLGQIIKKDIGKGIMIFCGIMLSFLLMFVLIGLITTPILYIWQIYDAYNEPVEG